MADTIIVAEETIHTFETSNPGIFTPEIPQSVIIHRTGENISSLEFANGKIVTINRIGEDITSIDDGIYLKTIERIGENIVGITVT